MTEEEALLKSLVNFQKAGALPEISSSGVLPLISMGQKLGPMLKASENAALQLWMWWSRLLHAQ